MGILLKFFFVAINVLIGQCAVYSPSGGPVYVNPNAAPAVQIHPTAVPKDLGYLVTQTVYGFLDFTTTIGNTIMVFSPQSAAPTVTESELPKLEIKAPVIKSVIDVSPIKIPSAPATTFTITEAITEPIAQPVPITPQATPAPATSATPPPPSPQPSSVAPSKPKEVIEITPSKPTAKLAEKKNHIISSVVQVVAEAQPASIIKAVSPTTVLPSPKPKPKNKPKSAANKLSGFKSSKIEILSSHVEIVTDTTPQSSFTPEISQEIKTKVEVREETSVIVEKPTIDSATTVVVPQIEDISKPVVSIVTKVEEKPQIIYSSIVEIRTTSSDNENDEHSEKENVKEGDDNNNEEDEDNDEKENETDAAEEEHDGEHEEDEEEEHHEEEHNGEQHDLSEHDNNDNDGEEEDEEEHEEEEQDDDESEHHGEHINVSADKNKQEEEPAPVLQIGNNIGEAEYDFLSRQPAEFIEETYRVVNLKPSNAKNNNREKTAVTKRQQANRNDDSHPTGLVTKLGGTVVKDGVTTVHETSVLGTYISGKYAQVLQSTSHIFHSNVKPKPTPNSSLRILKTAAPSLPKTPKYNLDPTPASLIADETNSPIDINAEPSPSIIRSSRKPATPSGNFKNRFRNRNIKDDSELQDIPEDKPVHTVQSSYKKSQRNNLGKSKNTRPNRYSTSSVELATVSVFTESATPAYASRRNKASRNNNFKPTSTYSAVSNNDAYTRRNFKPKVQATPVDHDSHSTSLYKFKLNRTPGRWQYKSAPKPRVSIRKQTEAQKNDELPQTSAAAAAVDVIAPVNDNSVSQQRDDNDVDLDSQSSINGDVLNDEDTLHNGIERKLPIETIKVEISTPADFKDTYYEIATIKSPYTFQVGTVKNTRYITVTSTFEKTLDPEPSSTVLTGPLTENILATTSHIDKEHNLLETSIATLPPITLSSDVETPPLETLTETFSTTQVMLKTHILPVVRGSSDTSSYTLIQTYHVTRLVTATKTLPPMELYQFVPSRTLNEFNSKLDEAGSELHLELEFGDENDHDEEDQPRRELPPDLDLSNIGSDFDLSDVDKTNIPTNARPKKKIATHVEQNKVQQQPQPETVTTPNLTPEQIQQLALLRLLNPAAAAQIPNVLTTSRPVVKLETIYESHVLPIVNGQSTIFSTISRPIATVSKTEYEIGTTTLPSLPNPPVPLNPFQQPQQQQQQQFQVTSSPIVQQTMLTQTDSKVLKLTFGAKTAYTTLFSTKVVPTILTTYITQSVPVQQTAGFPGFFPPYPPYPYVG